MRTQHALARIQAAVRDRPMRIAQDLGSELVIGARLALTDLVIDSPSDALRTGDLVRVARGG